MQKNLSDHIDDPVLTGARIEHLLELMFQRMDRLALQCQDGFPVFSPKAEDRWLISKGGSWTGGFWAGCWWLRAKITRAGSDRDNAAAICRRLAARLNDDSINRSMIFWYGAGLGDLWFDDDAARVLVKSAIDALADTYDPEMEAMALGEALGGGADGRRRINIDSLAALILLFGRSLQGEQDYLLQTHVDTLISVLHDREGAYYAYAQYDGGAYRTLGRAGDWSRGQAWAMLGLSRAAARWGEPYLTCALEALEYWRHSRLQGMPPNRLSQPEGFDDPSSAVIAALAMLALAERVPAHRAQLRREANRQIGTVVNSRYFIGDAAEAAGIFWGCCYKTRDREEPVESTWGSFMLMAALAALLGELDPGQC